jgi:hypothetical protein
MDFDSLLAEAEQDGPEPSPSPSATQPDEQPPADVLPAPDALKQSTLTFGQIQPEAYLPQLNEAQRKAVTAGLESMQILAGPGSGERGSVCSGRSAS